MSVDWDYDISAGMADVSDHTGLLLAEDAALKEYLEGLKVPEKNGKMADVQVWFRWPEGERRLTFPFITIDFLDISPSYDRWLSWHQVTETDVDFEVDGAYTRSGMYIPSTSPTLPEKDGETTGYHIDPFYMFKLSYQVVVHSRSALHDRFLTSRFMTDVFPPRSFWIGVEADHTWRRCELVDMTPADTMETTESGNKRLFRKVYTITMDAEIPYSRITEIERVHRVHIDLYPESAAEYPREPGNHLYSDEHTVAEPITVEPPPGS